MLCRKNIFSSNSSCRLKPGLTSWYGSMKQIHPLQRATKPLARWLWGKFQAVDPAVQAEAGQHSHHSSTSADPAVQAEGGQPHHSCPSVDPAVQAEAGKHQHQSCLPADPAVQGEVGDPVHRRCLATELKSDRWEKGGGQIRPLQQLVDWPALMLREIANRQRPTEIRDQRRCRSQQIVKPPQMMLLYLS